MRTNITTNVHIKTKNVDSLVKIPSTRPGSDSIVTSLPTGLPENQGSIIVKVKSYRNKQQDATV